MTQILKKDPLRETLIQWIGAVILPALVLICFPEIGAGAPFLSFISFFPTQSYLMSLSGHQTADPGKQRTIRRNLTFIYVVMSVIFLTINACGVATWIRIALSGLFAFFFGLSMHRANNFNVVKGVSNLPSLPTRLIQRWIPFLRFGSVLLSGTRPPIEPTPVAPFPEQSYSNLDPSNDLPRDVRALALDEFLKSGQLKSVQMYLELLDAALNFPDTMDTLLPSFKRFGIEFAQKSESTGTPHWREADLAMDPRWEEMGNRFSHISSRDSQFDLQIREFLLAYTAARTPNAESLARTISALSDGRWRSVGLSALFILANDGEDRTVEELQVLFTRAKLEGYVPETLNLVLRQLKQQGVVLLSDDGLHWAINPEIKNFIQRAFPDTLKLLARPEKRILEEDLKNRIRRLVWNARLHRRLGDHKSFLRIEPSVDAKEASRIVDSLADKKFISEVENGIPKGNSDSLYDVVIEMDPENPFLGQWVHPSFFGGPAILRIIPHDPKNDAVIVDMNQFELLWVWARERAFPVVRLDDARKAYLSGFIDSLSNETDSNKADIQTLFGLLLSKKMDVVNVASSLRVTGYSMGDAVQLIASFLSFGRPYEVTDNREKIQYFNEIYDPTQDESSSNIKDRVRYFLEKERSLSTVGRSFAGELEKALHGENPAKELNTLRDRFPSISQPHLEYFASLNEPHEGWEDFYTKLAVIQITDGCSKMCLHCFASPNGNVRSMSFERILQLLKQAEKFNASLEGRNPQKDWIGLYDASEAWDYYDPLFDADFGDVLVALNASLPRKKVRLTTRGWDTGNVIGIRAMDKIAKLVEQNPNLLQIRFSLDFFSTRKDFVRSLGRQLKILYHLIGVTNEPVQLSSVAPEEWNDAQGFWVRNVMGLFPGGKVELERGLLDLSLRGRAGQQGFRTQAPEKNYDVNVLNEGVKVSPSGGTILLKVGPENPPYGALWPEVDRPSKNFIQPRVSPVSPHPLEMNGGAGFLFSPGSPAETQIFMLGKSPRARVHSHSGTTGLSGIKVSAPTALLPFLGRPVFNGLTKWLGLSHRPAAGMAGFIEQVVLLIGICFFSGALDDSTGIGILISLIILTIPSVAFFPSSHGKKVFEYAKNSVLSGYQLNLVDLTPTHRKQLLKAAAQFFGIFILISALPHIALFVGVALPGTPDFYAWVGGILSSIWHGLYDYFPSDNHPVALGGGDLAGNNNGNDWVNRLKKMSFALILFFSFGVIDLGHAQEHHEGGTSESAVESSQDTEGLILFNTNPNKEEEKGHLSGDLAAHLSALEKSENPTQAIQNIVTTLQQASRQNIQGLAGIVQASETADPWLNSLAALVALQERTKEEKISGVEIYLRHRNFNPVQKAKLWERVQEWAVGVLYGPKGTFEERLLSLVPLEALVLMSFTNQLPVEPRAIADGIFSALVLSKDLLALPKIEYARRTGWDNFLGLFPDHLRGAVEWNGGTETKPKGHQTRKIFMGGRWPWVQPLYDFFGTTWFGQVAMPVLIEWVAPAGAVLWGMAQMGIPLTPSLLVSGVGVYLLLWHGLHLVGAPGSWREKLRFAFSPEKRRIAYGTFAMALLAAIYLNFGVSPDVLGAEILSLLSIPHVDENTRLLKNHLLGGPAQGQIEQLKIEVDIKKLRYRVAKDRAVLDAQRRSLASTLGLAPDANIIEIAKSSARRHQSSPSTSFIKSEVETILAIAYAEAKDVGAAKKRVAAAVQAYRDAQNLMGFESALAAAVKDNKEIALEITSTMLSRDPKNISQADMAQWRRLEILAQWASNGKLTEPVHLLLSDGIQVADVQKSLSRRVGQSISVRFIGKPKSELSLEGGKYSLNQFVDWIQSKNGGREHLIDLYPMSRTEWVWDKMVKLIQNNVRILVDAMPGLVLDRTDELNTEIRRIIEVDVKA